MTLPLHTPYDGSSKPFTIALGSLDLDDWIEVDDRLSAMLGEKDRLFAHKRDLVFRAGGDTLEAQQEVLQLLMAYLPARYPALYQTVPGGIAILPAGHTYKIDDYAARPLELAARLVQDDLILMRPAEGEHKLVAAALCFPSSWSLSEKFAKPLADIHGPVPGFGRGGRTAAMIERIFANLKPEKPVMRHNWSLHDGPALHHPAPAHAKLGLIGDDGTPVIWLRVERQTLRKLPLSGDILFTIKICIDPVGVLTTHPDGAQLAASLAGQIRALDTEQNAYKGLAVQKMAVLGELDKIAATKG